MKIIGMLGAVVLWTLACATVSAQSIDKFPFDKWAAENRKGQVRWSTRLQPTQLSAHQRQLVTFDVVVDGFEIRSRAGHADMVAFARISKGTDHWDSAVSIQMSGAGDGLQSREYGYQFRAFVQPGDYSLSLAVCDTTTLDHSFKRINLRVPALKNDPLPGSARSLPPVEFLAQQDTLDGWYLPEIHAVPDLATTARELSVQLVVNTTPTNRSDGEIHAIPWNMQNVLPALKMIAAIHTSRGLARTSFLDIASQQTTYDSSGTQLPDWPKMKAAIVKAGPGLTNADALAGRAGMLAYLHAELARRVANGNSEAVIFLSEPVRFVRQELNEPEPAEGSRDRRLFYIQYDREDSRVQPGQILQPNRSSAESRAIPTPDPSLDPSLSAMRRTTPMPIDVMSPRLTTLASPPRGSSPGAQGDDLIRVLKPMGARIFSVSTPLEFRRAIAAIMDEIGKL